MECLKYQSQFFRGMLNACGSPEKENVERVPLPVSAASLLIGLKFMNGVNIIPLLEDRRLGIEKVCEILQMTERLEMDMLQGLMKMYLM
jgi:hypothetical protein